MLFGGRHQLGEEGHDVGHDVGVEVGFGEALLRAAAVVHHDQAGVELGRHIGQRDVAEAARVVHDVGARFEHGPSDGRLVCVDRERDVGERSVQVLDDRHDGLDLVRDRGLPDGGDGGLAADVEDVRPVDEQPFGQGEPAGEVGVEAGVGERVGIGVGVLTALSATCACVDTVCG